MKKKIISIKIKLKNVQKADSSKRIVKFITPQQEGLKWEWDKTQMIDIKYKTEIPLNIAKW